jgi:hypothetical protein
LTIKLKTGVKESFACYELDIEVQYLARAILKTEPFETTKIYSMAIQSEQITLPEEVPIITETNPIQTSVIVGRIM